VRLDESRTASSLGPGVVYVATVKKPYYLKVLLASMQSVRLHDPELPIHVHADKPELVLEAAKEAGMPLVTASAIEDRRGVASTAALLKDLHLRDTHEALLYYKLAKIHYAGVSPFGQVLFLDSDAIACDSLQPLFGYLDRHDFFATRTFKNREVENNYSSKTHAYRSNSGVMGYRAGSRAHREVLGKWEAAYLARVQRFATDPKQKGNVERNLKDQHTLAELLADVSPRMCRLADKWNVRDMTIETAKDVKILHKHVKRTSHFKIPAFKKCVAHLDFPTEPRVVLWTNKGYKQQGNVTGV